MKKNFVFVVIGTFFGFFLLKGEVISWYRIQEMFYFRNFHMYGVIGSAVAVGSLSIQFIKIFKIKSINGEEIHLNKKPTQYKAHLFGGILFGIGWSLTGACPAPLYALLGSGLSYYIIPIAMAVLGTYTYAVIKSKLPH